MIPEILRIGLEIDYVRTHELTTVALHNSNFEGQLTMTFKGNHSEFEIKKALLNLAADTAQESNLEAFLNKTKEMTLAISELKKKLNL